jgi:hypothetical protein
MRVSEALNKLARLKPNKGLSDTKMVKGSFGRCFEAWCPLHVNDRMKLSVRWGDSNELVLECAAGCSHGDVETYIARFGAGACRQNQRRRPPLHLPPRAGPSRVIDARHLFARS